MQTYSLNKVILVGRLGADPKGRYTQKGVATTSFSIATNERWKNSEGGGWQDHTEWHNVVAWGKLAEFSSEQLYKGQLIQVEGMLRTRSWKDDKQAVHKITEVLCSQIVPLEKRGTSN
tara:strand:- start:1299 stop:1652 length:354 start_codon:yes stop_codon:yes gene_type:complete